MTTSRRPEPAPANVRIGDEIVLAVSEGRPLVALESAVLTHGLPYPENLRAAGAVEEAIRETGSTPATCLIARGQLWIGAPGELIETTARSPEREKASVRDLGAAVVSGAYAGLTVSATLFAAHLAGIQVFATGGIGGVHAPAATGDVSADLLQLSRTPVITVCSGAKSVLDIPRTLEFLETAGVPVFSYRSECFPAFYLTSSGLEVPAVQSPAEIARVARTQWDLGYHGGLVLGNPIPSDAAIDPAEWAQWLETAQADATRHGIRGKAVTPFLLGRVAELSEGRTVHTNIALLVNNARLAGRIAAALPA